MILNELRVHHVRTISCLQLALHDQFTFIIGPNGSGKTSLLEACYLLSCGRSFRSNEHASLISHGQTQLNVFARSKNQESISIQKSHQGVTQVKLNNQACKKASEMALVLPTQVFYSELFQIIDAGPGIRRSLLDWGLFHLKPDYLSLWQQYKKILKQRNALLKTNAPYPQFIPWDTQLSDLANRLHGLREDYFRLWQDSFSHVLLQLTDTPCSIRYFKGWDKKNAGLSLNEVLSHSFSSDKQKLYTQYGAHQADILIESACFMAKSILSRGQQKIILMALKLAQADLLQKPCLYLLDDLASELDEEHQQKLMHCLSSRAGQYVISNLSSLPLISYLEPHQFAVYNVKEYVSRETYSTRTST